MIPKCTSTLFRIGLFRAARGWWYSLSPKICHTYPTMMKLGTVGLSINYIYKNINHMKYSMSFSDISIFSLEISNFCYIKKVKY